MVYSCGRLVTSSNYRDAGNADRNILSWMWRSRPRLDTGRSDCKLMGMSQQLWHVAHTRPRCEKKLLQYCGRENLEASLPCYKAVHKYRGKTVVFKKPLFPGYVFLQISAEKRGTVIQSDYLANLLEVTDQALFVRQLGEVLRAVETDLEIRLAPTISEGLRVKIKSGPLRGIEGLVEKRYGMTTVLLRLDFINQAAAVKLEASDLELI